MNASCAVIVFAKAPAAGFSKTRLIPALGEEGAAKLAERLLAGALTQACAAAIGPVELCCTPNQSHSAFAQMARIHGVTLTEQGAGDLGARMSRALERSLSVCQSAILIGTDAPALDAQYLRDACELLSAHEAVFGPATDGGYTLIGLRQPIRELFVEMPWSTQKLMQRTRECLVQLNVSHAELSPLSDVDEPEDLRHVPESWLTESAGAQAARVH